MSGSTLHIRFNDTTTAVTMKADGGVSIGDSSFAIESLEPGVYVVEGDARRWTVAVAGPVDDRWISIDGQVYRVEVSTEGRARKKTKGGGADALMAPMPATVVKLLVEPGATVAEGDTLIVLEAMKMELAIRAPRSGVVGVIHCAAGQLVQPGVALLELS